MQTFRLLLLFTILIGLKTNAQVKIDSLGFHLGTNNEFIVDVRDKSTEEIRVSLIEHVKENNWEIVEDNNPDYLKISMFDNFMVYNRRSGVDGYVGQNTTFVIDFKDGKFRIRNMEPNFFFMAGSIANRPEFIKEKKKKPFLIVGNGNTLYDSDMVLRRSQRKIKPQIEAYYNNIINKISEKLNKSKQSEW